VLGFGLCYDRVKVSARFRVKVGLVLGLLLGLWLGLALGLGLGYCIVSIRCIVRVPSGL
jgi:hypothetical protein